MIEYYDSIKALHIIAVVCWFAGLFYLPRIFVYHTQTKPKSESSELFKVMERKLYVYIMRPSMILSWVFGLWMIHLIPEWMEGGWMHAKLTLVVLLTGYHHICGAHVKRFAKDENNKSEKYFRVFNEVPTLVLLAAVFLVVLKPF